MPALRDGLYDFSEHELLSEVDHDCFNCELCKIRVGLSGKLLSASVLACPSIVVNCHGEQDHIYTPGNVLHKNYSHRPSEYRISRLTESCIGSVSGLQVVASIRYRYFQVHADRLSSPIFALTSSSEGDHNEI